MQDESSAESAVIATCPGATTQRHHPIALRQARGKSAGRQTARR